MDTDGAADVEISPRGGVGLTSSFEGEANGAVRTPRFGFLLDSPLIASSVGDAQPPYYTPMQRRITTEIRPAVSCPADGLRRGDLHRGGAPLRGGERVDDGRGAEMYA